MATVRDELVFGIKVQITDASKNLDSIAAKAGKTANKIQEISKKGDLNKPANSMKKLASETDKASKSVDNFKGKTGRAREGMMKMITTGVALGVGWQLITGVLTLATNALRDLAFAGVELEATMVSMQLVADRTGRSFGEMMGIVNQEVDAFTARGPVMQASLRLMSTSLDNKQIQQFIQLVKDGSAAMGEQANIQLPMVASGFRRLNANVLDNIGVNVRLDKVQRRVARSLGVSVQDLTNAQIEQGLFNEMIKQGEVFIGAYDAQINTAKGSLAKITTEWNLFAEAVSEADIVKVAADFAANLIKIGKESIMLEDVWKRWGVVLERPGDEISKITRAIAEAAGIPIMGTPSGFLAGLSPDELIKVTGSLDSTILSLGELSETMQSGRLTSEKYADANILMEQAIAQIAIGTGKREEEIRKMIETQKDQIILQEKLNPLLETSNSIMEDTIIKNKEAREAIRMTFIEYSKSTKELEFYNNELIRLQKEVKNSEDAIKDKRRAITENSFAISGWRKEIKSLNIDLKDEQNELKNIIGVIDDLEKQIKKKELALFPEQFLETEDILKDVQRELKGAQSDLERAQSALFKRVEPLLFKKAQEDAAKAQQNVIELAKKEEETKKKLEQEIAELNIKLTDQNILLNAQQLAVNNTTAEIDGYNSKIQDAQDENDKWRREITLLQQSIEDNRELLTDYEDNIKDTSDAIKGMGKAIDSAKESIVKWNETELHSKFARAVIQQEFIPATKKMTLTARFGEQKGTKFIEQDMDARLHRGEVVFNRMEASQPTLPMLKLPSGGSSITQNFGREAIQINAQDRSMSDVFDELNRIIRFQSTTKPGGAAL